MRLSSSKILVFFIVLCKTFHVNAQDIKEWKNMFESADRKYNQDQFDSSLILIDSFLTSDQREDGFLVFKGYLLKAQNLLHLKRYAEALNYALKAANGSKNLEGEMYRIIYFRSVVVIGIIYYQQKRLKEAEDQLSNALDFLPPDDSSKYVLSCLYYLTRISLENDYLFKSYKYCSRGIEIAEEKRNFKYLPLFQSMMADTYYELKYYQKAIEYKRQALESFQGQNDHLKVASGLFDLGLFYENEGERELDTKYYSMCLDYSRVHGFDNLIMSTYRNLAYKEIGNENFEIAFPIIDSALYYAEKKNYKNDILYLISSKVTLLSDKKDVRGALTTAKINFGLNDSINRGARIDYYETVGNLYSGRGLWKEGYEYFQNSNNLLHEELDIIKEKRLKEHREYITDHKNTFSVYRQDSTISTKNRLPNWLVAISSSFLTFIIILGIRKWKSSQNLDVIEGKGDEKSSNLDSENYITRAKKGKLPDLIVQGEERIKLNDNEVQSAKNIIRIDRDDSYLRVFIKGEEKYVAVWKSLDHFEEVLPFPLFYRIHKSDIINIQEVKNGIISKDNQLEMKNGDMVRVAARRKKKVKDHLEKHLLIT